MAPYEARDREANHRRPTCRQFKPAESQIEAGIGRSPGNLRSKPTSCIAASDEQYLRRRPLKGLNKPVGPGSRVFHFPRRRIHQSYCGRCPRLQGRLATGPHRHCRQEVYAMRGAITQVGELGQRRRPEVSLDLPLHDRHRTTYPVTGRDRLSGRKSLTGSAAAPALLGSPRKALPNTPITA